MNMKILQVAFKVPYPPKDGGALAMLNMAIGYKDLGHVITVLSANTRKHFASIADFPDEIKEIADFHMVNLDTSVRLPRLILNLFTGKLPYNAERFISVDFEKKLTGLLQENQYDIVQVEGIYMGLYIPIIRKYFNGKILFRAHNVEWQIWQRIANNSMNPVKRAYFKILSNRMRRLELKILNSGDLVFPITRNDRDIFQEMGCRLPMFVAPFGIETSVYKKLELPDLSNGLRRLVFIGSLDWIPNQEGLLWFLQNVWRPFKKKHPHVIFAIAGRNAPPSLVKKIQKFPVIYSGEVNNSQDFIGTGEIMVAPLFSGSGMRVKNIEAMALGRCVMTSAVGAEGLDVTHMKNIILADTAQDYLNNLELLSVHPGKISEIGKEAFSLVREKFDNLVICSEMLNFIANRE